MTADEVTEQADDVMTADEVTKQIDEMTARFAVELRADAQKNLRQLREVRTGFNERLRTYWGGSFDLYELLCACMQEVGADLVKRNVGNNPPLFHALSRTHAKACRVADEVYVLLVNGHGGGALGRCRTLHEFSVIAAVLAQCDGGAPTRFRTSRSATWLMAAGQESMGIMGGHPDSAGGRSRRLRR
jgi:hypothetical protein